MILREIGSNFLIKDEKILLEHSAPFRLLHQVKNVIQADKKTFELMQSSSGNEKNALEDALISTWSA